MRITSPTPHPHLRCARIRSSRIKVLSLPPSQRDEFQQRRKWFIPTGYDFLPSSRHSSQQYHRRFQQWCRIHECVAFQSLLSSRRDDFQWRHEWFIGMGYDFLPSSRCCGQQYHCCCQPRHRIYKRNACDDDSLSTTAEMFDAVHFAPILEDLRQIAINWWINFEDESYTVNSCFGFTESEIHYIVQDYPDSFLNWYFHCPSSDPHQVWITKEIPKKLHWVYKSAQSLCVSFPWRFGIYALSEDALFLHISLFRYDNISFYLFFRYHSNS